MGIITASFKEDLAYSKPAISSHLTLGFSETIASLRADLNLSASLSLPCPPPPVFSYIT